MKKILFFIGLLSLLVLLTSCDDKFESVDQPASLELPNGTWKAMKVDFVINHSAGDMSSGKAPWYIHLPCKTHWGNTNRGCQVAENITFINGTTTGALNTTIVQNHSIVFNVFNNSICGIGKTEWSIFTSIEDINVQSGKTNVTIWLNVSNVTDYINISYALGDQVNSNLDDWTCGHITYINPCIPNWTCSGYGSCNTSDLAPCNETVDLNACNVSYTGNYSEFASQACNYCAADVQTISTGDCDSVTDTQWIFSEDNNWATCCNLTQIVADCPTGLNSSTINGTQSCSIFDYTEADLPKAAVNTIAKIIISFGFFIVIIIFTYFIGFMVKNWKE